MLDLLDEITADTRQYTDSQIRNFNEVCFKTKYG